MLTKATDLLGEIEKLGLFTTIEKGIFADVKRPKDGGKGLAGVVVKDDKYFNPFLEVMKGRWGRMSSGLYKPTKSTSIPRWI